MPLNTINLSAGGASGDSSSCSFTNVSNQANVTCIITVSNTEGARAQLSGSMTDINSNTGTFTATAYTVDDTAPAIGTPTISGGGVLPSLQPVFSNIGSYTNLALSVRSRTAMQAQR